MAKGTTEIVVSEDKTNQPPPPPPLQLPNLQNLFPLLSNFKLPFSIPKKPKQEHSPIADGDAAAGDRKRSFVRIPKAQVAVPPQRLEVEVEESITKTSNPVIIWQVYAIGAFFITAWAVSRWRERSGRGKSPNDDRAE